MKRTSCAVFFRLATFTRELPTVPRRNQNRMRIRAVLIPLLLFAALLSMLVPQSSLWAQSLPNHEFNTSNPNNPYGLNLNGFTFGDYEYCKWGNLMSTGYYDDGRIYTSFGKNTQGPFANSTYAGTSPELFLLESNSTLVRVPFPATASWNPAGGSFEKGFVNFALASPGIGMQTALMRKLHFRNILDGRRLYQTIPRNAEKLIILVHGWNEKGDSGMVSFETVADEVQKLLLNDGNSGWHLSLYRWEEDADTGSKFPVRLGLGGPCPDPVNPTEAATIGYMHGQHLGEILANWGRLRKVHLIVHSAGTWVARAAARHLLQNTNIQVQLTLLDPFIPGAISNNNTPLTTAFIDSLPSLDPSGSRQLYFLENIYAHDIDNDPLAGLARWGTDTCYSATSQIFSWHPSIGRSLRVDWSPGGTPTSEQAMFYDEHSGPVAFYSDTILDTISGNNPSGLANFPEHLPHIGWQRSMFFREPKFSAPLNDQTVSVNQTATFTVAPEIRGQPNQSPAGLTLQWQVQSADGTWNNIGNGSTSFVIPAVSAAMGGNKYRAVATYDGQSETSREATLTVLGVVSTPASPTTLSTTAASTSQINLAWRVTSTNETGIRIERRQGSSGTWLSLPLKPPGTATLSDTGLAADTDYTYRVSAFNSAGSSGFSNESTARTRGTSATLRQVTVASANPFSGVSYSISPSPVTTSGAGVLSFTEGTEITLTAPATANGNVFLRWEKDGLPYTTTQAARFVVTGNHLLYMIFGTPSGGGTNFAVSLGAAPVGGGTATGEGTYASGANVTINAYPAGGFRFVNWTQNGGQAFSAAPNFAFQATSNLSLVANFAAISGGNVIATTASPATSGTTSGDGSYQNGQIATVSAAPAPGWEFGTWTENGAIVSFSSSFSYPVYQSHNYVASFNPILSQNYTLAITAQNGTAIRNPNQVAYAPGTQVTITATAASGFYFTGWSQDASGTQNPLTVSMGSNLAVTANFAPVPLSTYTLDLPPRVGGTVAKSPNQPFYNAGTQVSVTATANAGYAFAGWRRSGFGTANPLTVSMDSNKQVVANFAQVSPSSAVLTLGLPFTKNVSGTAGSGSGEVKNVGSSGILYWEASPTVSWIQVNTGGNGGTPVTPISGSSGLAFSFEENPTATSRTGEIYVYAPGAQNNPQIYTIVQAAGVPKYALTVLAENGMVSRAPDQQSYAQGSLVQLTATPTAGYAFTGWSGNASGSQNPISVTMDQAKAVTANFQRLPNPDLVPELTLPPSSGVVGGKIALSGTVANRGADASSPAKVYFRLTSSSTTAPSISVSGEAPFASVTALSPASESTFSSSVDVPANLAPGQYFVWVVLDPESSGGELPGNRTNNNLALPITIFPDTAEPTLAITAPVAVGRITTNATTVNLAGTAADNVSVTQVSWATDRGATGTAIGTDTWAINAVPLQPGENVINVTASDAAGHTATKAITVSYAAPDLAPPVVGIMFPTTTLEFSTAESRVNLSGEATDDVSVRRLTWSNSRGGSGDATGTRLWLANNIPLQAGLNNLTVTVEDDAGKTSTDSLAVTYTPRDADGDGIADAWEMQFFGNLDMAGTITDTGEIGTPDFLKFAFGMDPTRPDLLALPKVSLAEEGANTYLTLKYRHLMVAGGLSYQVGVSGNLTAWDYSETQIEQIGLPAPTGDGLTEEITVRLTVPMETLGQVYLQLKVLRSP